MSFYCIDSNVFIYGVQSLQHVSQDKDKVRKAEDFFQWLSENDFNYFLPSVVISEILLLTPPEKHDEIMQDLVGDFVILPFDAPAAHCASKLWYENTEKGMIDQLREDPDKTKNRLKVDLQILGTAITNQADKVISEDPDMKKLSGKHIDVQEIPLVDPQLGLDFSEGTEDDSK